jgi:hypothetical protein
MTPPMTIHQGFASAAARPVSIWWTERRSHRQRLGTHVQAGAAVCRALCTTATLMRAPVLSPLVIQHNFPSRSRQKECAIGNRIVSSLRMAKATTNRALHDRHNVSDLRDLQHRPLRRKTLCCGCRLSLYSARNVPQMMVVANTRSQRPCLRCPGASFIPISVRSSACVPRALHWLSTVSTVLCRFV